MRGKKIITIEDIGKKKEQETNQNGMMGFLDNLHKNLEKKNEELKKKQEEMKKNRPLWKKLLSNLGVLLTIIVILNLFLGSIWILILLIKYFIGLF